MCLITTHQIPVGSGFLLLKHACEAIY